jgi:hypothetical protein
VDRALVVRDWFAGILSANSDTRFDAIVDAVLSMRTQYSDFDYESKLSWGGFMIRNNRGSSDEWMIVVSGDGAVSVECGLWDGRQLEWVQRGRFRVSKYLPAFNDRFTISYRDGEDSATVLLSFDT